MALYWCFSVPGSDFEDLRGETKGLLRVFAAPFNFRRFTVNGDDMVGSLFGMHVEPSSICKHAFGETRRMRGMERGQP